MKEHPMGKKAVRYIQMIYLLLIFFITIYTIWNQQELWKEIVLFTLLYIGVDTVRRHYCYGYTWLIYATPVLEVIIIIPLAIMTNSAVSMWLIILTNIDLIIYMPLGYAIIFTAYSYLIYITIYLIKLKPAGLMSVMIIIMIAAMQYGIIMGVGFLARKFYNQQEKYRKLVALQKVQMLELEQMAVIKERNRMAGEIHDTVGHQLTTAMVQLEATMLIFDKDPSKVPERLKVIKEQVKHALQELRASVRELGDERYLRLEDKLEELTNQVLRTTGIVVKTTYKGVEDIPTNYRKTVFLVVMESITNAIKHGRCASIELGVACREGAIEVLIKNDGIVPDAVEEGFGLKSMKENVTTLDGTLNYGKEERCFKVRVAFEL